MSAQTMQDAFAPVEAHYHAQVIAATFGHLAAQRNKTYRGWFVFAIPGYDSGDPCIIDSEFSNSLDDSPWLYDAMWSFAAETDAVPREEYSGCRVPESTGVYRFDGTVRNYQFKGTVRKIKLGGCDE